MVKSSPNALRCMVVTAASANIEFSVVSSVQGLDCVVPGDKYDVLSIYSMMVNPPIEQFDMTTARGRRITISSSDGSSRIPAGSSVNVAIVLRKLGLDDVGIYAPVGSGDGGMFMANSIAGQNLQYLLLQGDGTARTLAVRDLETGETTLFCQKTAYHLSDEAKLAISEARPSVVIATSVKPQDLDLIETLFAAESVGWRFFVPHQTLLKDLDLHPRMKGLMEQADLLQMNQREASIFLGKDFRPEDTREVAEKSGAKVAVVTMGAQGSSLYDRQKRQAFGQKGVKVEKVVDSSGAGDVHLATLIYYHWIASEWPLQVCLEMAGWVASRTIQSVGPWSSMPSPKECEAKLSEILEVVTQPG